MRKILSVLAAIGLTSTAASAVVACGNKDSSEVTKTDLSSVPMIKALESKLTINGTADMGVDDAYASFSNISGVKEALAFVNLGEADFEFVLTVPSYVADGSLKITVKSENSKYSGSLNVKISQLVKAELSSVSGLITTTSGSSDMNETNVLNTFLAVEGNQGLQGEVEVKAGSFEAPGTETEGSFILEAIAGNHKYTGELDVTISGYTVALDSLKDLTKTIDGTVDMTADDAFNTFLSISGNEILKDEVEIKSGDESFVLPTNDDEGQLVIVARTGSAKYTGEIPIIISKLDTNKKHSFSKLFDKVSDKLKIDSTADMTEESAFNAFSEKIYIKPILFASGLKMTDFTFELELPTTIKDGSLTISIDNAKYTGFITVIINKLSDNSAETTSLSTNDDHKTTVITLSTEDSLRLGYIKKEGDKYVAGDKLPNGPLTTKIGESTITATFTPNFENGTVQVLLTIDTPTNN